MNVILSYVAVDDTADGEYQTLYVAVVESSYVYVTSVDVKFKLSFVDVFMCGT